MAAPDPTDAAIYLDHNATTPVLPEVRDAMLPWLGERWGNPSSAHAFGRAAAAAVAAAREEVAALIGAEPGSILFCSGGTEADNLALLGAAAARGAPGRLMLSAVEHEAVNQPAAALVRRGWSRVLLPVGPDGVLDRAAATAAIGAAPPDLASLILAQNETGALQPVAELAAAIRARAPAAVIHSDAAQAVGKVEVDVRALGVDLLTVAGHKIYAPAGVGALYVRPGVRLEPLFGGGGHERGLRPGTEAVAALVGLGAAARLARRTLRDEAERQRALRELLWGRLAAAIPGLYRTAGAAPTLPGTLHLCFPGVSGEAVLARAELVAASTASACHGHGGSAVLAAMGLDPARAAGAVRLSLGRGTDLDAVERAAAALLRGWQAASAGR